MVARTALAVLSAVALYFGATYALGPARFEVVRPHAGAPAVLRPGDTVQIELVSSIPYWGPELSVELDGPGGRHPLTVEATETSLLGTRTVLRASIPTGVPSRVFDLRVSTAGAGDTRPLAVHVVEEYPENARFVQMADLPLVGDRGPGDAEMEALIEEINLIAPDFVLITGDLVYLENDPAYEALVEYLYEFDAPVILAAGNHEYPHWTGFLRHFERPRHVVDLGGLYVVTLNSAHRHDQLTASQLRWLKEVMAERPGRTPLIQIHYPLFGTTSIVSRAAAIAEAAAAHGSPLVLSGHIHYDAMFDGTGRLREDSWEFEGPKFVVTTPAGSQDLRPTLGEGPMAYPGYRLVRMAGGRILSLTYDLDGDGKRDAASSYPFGLLQVSSPEPRTSVVSNGLNEAIEGARVKTIVAGRVPGLRPDQGRTVDVRFEGDSTIYVTEIDLPAESVTVLRLETPEAS